ncbi:UDP-glucose/GDP-mannose dehydrogenase family protein [Patescibacteria group bacterium]|nr:UDP-glucose/GDP-mannose dehydrogenase family protein [Patescibacteria group bacterium]
MKIACIGTGFVGVVTSAIFASHGHEVVGLDIDENKVKSLSNGEVPFFEPGLSELLKKTLADGHLTFTNSYKKAISNAEIIFIMVGTPSAADGQADLKYVFAAAESMAPYLKKEAVVVVKSTVPPGTSKEVAKIIKQKTKTSFTTASVPEFLREGSAVEDTLHPSRVVIGTTDKKTGEKLTQLHRPLSDKIIIMKPESAQMAKYASNTYLATRITFINQIADLCEKNGADVEEVVAGIGEDPRIGTHYWYPGFGYGGSCFPKDVSELAAYSRAVGESNNLMNKVHELNLARTPYLMEKMGQKIGGWKDKQVAVLGLSFKPNTDDTREAPSTAIIKYLQQQKANIFGFDPRAKWSGETTNFSQKKSLEEAVAHADVIIAVIEWPEIISFDFSKTKLNKPQFFIDGRNQFDPATIKNWNYIYLSIGRG